MLAKTALLRYNNYSDKKRVIICVLKGILDVCFSVKSAHLFGGFRLGFKLVYHIFKRPVFKQQLIIRQGIGKQRFNRVSHVIFACADPAVCRYMQCAVFGRFFC